MEKQATELQDKLSMLKQILITPSQELKINRFSSQSIDTSAPCQASCTGVCR